MSVSSIGSSNTNNWYQLWADLKARSAASTQTAASSQGTTSDPTAAVAGAAAAYSVQTVTGTSGTQPLSAQASNAFQQAMNALGSSLQSGDLSGAQDAFSQASGVLSKSGVHHHHHHHGGGGASTSSSSSTDSTSSTDPFAQAFGTLGQDLSSGDLTGAQSAFAQLQSLLAGATNPLTTGVLGANSPANPAGGAIDLTA